MDTFLDHCDHRFWLRATFPALNPVTRTQTEIPPETHWSDDFLARGHQKISPIRSTTINDQASAIKLSRSRLNTPVHVSRRSAEAGEFIRRPVDRRLSPDRCCPFG